MDGNSELNKIKIKEEKNRLFFNSNPLKIKLKYPHLQNMDLQKKVKEVDEDKKQTTNNVTNNALYVGSKSELSKILKQGILNNKEDS